jgi:hypothetical protein
MRLRDGGACLAFELVLFDGSNREGRQMQKTKSDKKHADPMDPLIKRTGARSSPGSGEDGTETDRQPDDEEAHEDEDEAADLQPHDVENGDTAR